MDLKFTLASAVAELSEGVAGMGVDDALTRRPKRAAAHTAFRRVLLLRCLANLILHPAPCPPESWWLAVFSYLSCLIVPNLHGGASFRTLLAQSAAHGNCLGPVASGLQHQG